MIQKNSHSKGNIENKEHADSEHFKMSFVVNVECLQLTLRKPDSIAAIQQNQQLVINLPSIQVNNILLTMGFILIIYRF